MEDRLATWNKKQVQRNSPVNLMSIKERLQVLLQMRGTSIMKPV
jgi:hypothetical protein